MITHTPGVLTIGETAEWAISLPDYPAPDWVLSYTLVSSGVRITITGEQDGSTSCHKITVAVADQALWTPAVYGYQARVTDGASVFCVESGTIKILPDFSVMSSGYDARIHARICLDNITAVIEGRATKSQQQYSIAGRALQFVPLKELVEMRAYWLGIVNTEIGRELAGRTGRSRFRAVEVRFG